MCVQICGIIEYSGSETPCSPSAVCSAAATFGTCQRQCLNIPQESSVSRITGLRTTDLSGIDDGSHSVPDATRWAKDEAVLRRNLAKAKDIAAGLIAGIANSGPAKHSHGLGR